MSNLNEQTTVPGYFLEISSNWNWRLCNRQTNKNESSPANGSKTFAIGTWHTLKLVFQGLNIEGWIDGTKVATVSDGSYAKGNAGRRVGRGLSGTSEKFTLPLICPEHLKPLSVWSAKAIPSGECVAIGPPDWPRGRLLCSRRSSGGRSGKAGSVSAFMPLHSGGARLRAPGYAGYPQGQRRSALAPHGRHAPGPTNRAGGALPREAISQDRRCAGSRRRLRKS